MQGKLVDQQQLQNIYKEVRDLDRKTHLYSLLNFAVRQTVEVFDSFLTDS